MQTEQPSRSIPDKVYRRIVQLASKVVNLDPGDKVLDIQCGSGELLCLYDHNKVKTFGIDTDGSAVAEGHTKKRFHYGIIGKFEFSPHLANNGKYKVITYLYFDKLDVQFFTVAKQLLHPDGVMILLTDSTKLIWLNTWFTEKGLGVVGCEIFREDEDIKFVALLVTMHGHELDGYSLLANEKFMLYKNMLHLQLTEWSADEPQAVV